SDGTATGLQFRSAPGRAIASPASHTITVDDLVADARPGKGDAIRVVTLSIEVLSPEGDSLGVWTNFPIDPKHETGGLPDSLFAEFGDDEESQAMPIIATPRADLKPLEVLAALYGDATGATTLFDNEDDLTVGVGCTHVLAGGNDGLRPGQTEYEGAEHDEE